MENKENKENRLPNPLINRRGIIHISEELLHKDPDEATLRAIFTNVFPVRIEREYERNKGLMRVFCLSPMFDEIESSDMAPEYVLVIERSLENIKVKDVIKIEKLDG